MKMSRIFAVSAAVILASQLLWLRPGGPSVISLYIGPVLALAWFLAGLAFTARHVSATRDSSVVAILAGGAACAWAVPPVGGPEGLQAILHIIGFAAFAAIASVLARANWNVSRPRSVAIWAGCVLG